MYQSAIKDRNYVLSLGFLRKYNFTARLHGQIYHTDDFLSVQEQNTSSVNMTEKSKIATKYHLLKIWSWLEFSRREEVDACPSLIFYTALHRLMKTTEQQEKNKSNKRRRVGKELTQVILREEALR